MTAVIVVMRLTVVRTCMCTTTTVYITLSILGLPTVSSTASGLGEREGMSWVLIGGVAGGIVGELAFAFLLGTCIVIGMRYHRRHNKTIQITSPNRAASALQLESAVSDVPARLSILNLQIKFPETSAASEVEDSSVVSAIHETLSSSLAIPSAQEAVEISVEYDKMSTQIASASDELTAIQVSFISNNPLLQSNSTCSQEQDQIPSAQELPPH